MEFHLTRNIMDYLELFIKRKSVTKSTQPLDPIRYYFMLGYLRQYGLIQEDGFDRNQKVWVLSKKGKKLAALIARIKGVMSDEG